MRTICRVLTSYVDRIYYFINSSLILKMEKVVLPIYPLYDTATAYKTDAICDDND